MDAHKFRIVKEYEDAAISGTTENRHGFQLMLSEVAKNHSYILIMWKTDHLGRDKYVLAMAKNKIRDAGCEILLLAENLPTEGLEGVFIEGLMESMAEYYSKQLSQDIRRGMDYPVEHALKQITDIFTERLKIGSNKIIVSTNLKQGLPLENINKIAGPLIEAWAGEILVDAMVSGNRYCLENVEI